MPTLSEELKDTIQSAYRRFLAERGLKPRLGQRQMIGTIASTLGAVDVNEDNERQGDTPIAVVEAGTGTGETLGDLLAVLPIARAMGKKVVVATGTVALQGQLVDKDLPDILKATGWQYRHALAKGRGRYLCNIRLEHCMDVTGARQSGFFLYEDEMPFRADKASAEFFQTLSDSLEQDQWNGDRDSWPQAIDDSVWRALTVDRRQCAGHRCRKVHQCAFFRARSELDDADIIIANHDLVMADLSLGGGAILPPPEETIYVFDEAHRLADTTLRHFAGSCRLQGTVQWLEQTEKGVLSAIKVVAEDRQLVVQLEEISRYIDEALQANRQAIPVVRSILDNNLPGGVGHYRFPLGDVGEDIRNLATTLARALVKLCAYLEDVSSVLEKKLDGYSDVPRVDLEQLHQGVGNWLGRLESVASVWSTMSLQDEAGLPPFARWLSTDEQGMDIQVSVSPISAGDLLRENLWHRAFGVVVTSATLRALGSFERFAVATGLPRHANAVAVPGSFDYQNAGVLAVPNIGADGGDASAHTEALIEHIEGLLDKTEATLVLFSSRRQMEQVADGLQRELRRMILMQGDFSHAEIIRRHREKIDESKGSIIFGLASFAEGLDLPGEYCRHVIIAKLPFAVPDDPLQSAQGEWLESRGLNPFMTMTLPDASLRLIQASGRLLRTEEDRGRVTILDRRVLTKFYGRQLLDALPPFRREIAP